MPSAVSIVFGILGLVFLAEAALAMAGQAFLWGHLDGLQHAFSTQTEYAAVMGVLGIVFLLIAYKTYNK